MSRRSMVQLIVCMLVLSLCLPAGKEAAAAPGVKAVSVSGGSAHGIAAWSDGTVTGWGYNKNGQVGDGTSINQYIPKKVEGLSGIVQVAAAGSVSFALSKEGEVWGWGQDYSSYIQNDPLLPNQRRGGPVKLEGLQEIASITTNGALGIAVTKDGTAILWYPSYDPPGVLPVQIRYLKLPAISGIKSALINGNDALFLTKDGSVKQMSIYHSYYNRIRLESDPVSIATLASSAITGMAASQGELFLLRSDGQVLRWNKGLQAPSAVAGLNNVYKLDTGFYRLYTLKRNGTLWKSDYSSGTLVKPIQIKTGIHISNIWGSSGTFGFAQHKDGILLGWGDSFDTGLSTGRGSATKDEAGYILAPVLQPLVFFVNGQPFSFYGSASVQDGKLYVPQTSVFKALGVQVSTSTSNPDPKPGNSRSTVWSFVYGDKTLQVKLSDPLEVSVNGKKSDREFTMNRLPDSTQLPLEVICELLGIGLQWNKVTGEVKLGN
ncbi:chromosome condensation regulator RCC1 [Paenibacillus tritici]|uniref:chromosome condensation regulator RCC1 n=1 Tax=Paenibacillus tritici TaxID=1873425 RepID=UPI001BA4C771|nr:chromosome condensation regulator RCC1 [Paenibacillus tritici]QUL57644.1 chromosome condensation regulator RCC1 [Paenibacillus tritici]